MNRPNFWIALVLASVATTTSGCRNPAPHPPSKNSESDETEKNSDKSHDKLIARFTESKIKEISLRGPKVPNGFYKESFPDVAKHRYGVTWFRGHATTQKAAEDVFVEGYRDSNVHEDVRKIVSRRQTDQFFEFRSKREVKDLIKGGVRTYWQYTRVWRSDYFQPTDPKMPRQQQRKLPIQMGIYKREPNVKNIKRFAELVWWSHHFTSGAKAISSPEVSETNVNQTEPAVSVRIPTVVYAQGDFGLREQFTLFNWILTVNKTSGEVTLDSTPPTVIKGRRNEGGRIK